MERRTVVLSTIGMNIRNGIAEQGKSTTEPGTASTTVKVSLSCRVKEHWSVIDSFCALTVSLVLWPCLCILAQSR